jgi:hypothetical protein
VKWQIELRLLFFRMQLSEFRFVNCDSFLEAFVDELADNTEQFLSLFLGSLPRDVSRSFRSEFLVETNAIECFLVISLNYKDFANLSQSFAAFLRNQKVDEIHHFPPFLIFQLNVFEKDCAGSQRVKIKKAFSLPAVVEIPLTWSDARLPVYHLIGVIYHIGNSETGHFISAAKVQERWFKIDDSEVTTFEPLSSDYTAFILFYSRSSNETASQVPNEPIVREIYEQNELQKKLQLLLSVAFFDKIMKFNDASLLVTYLLNVFCRSTFFDRIPQIVEVFRRPNLVKVSEGLRFMSKSEHLRNCQSEAMRLMLVEVACSLMTKLRKKQSGQSRSFLESVFDDLPTEMFAPLLDCFLANFPSPAEWEPRVVAKLLSDDNKPLLLSALRNFPVTVVDVFYANATLFLTDVGCARSFDNFLYLRDLFDFERLLEVEQANLLVAAVLEGVPEVIPKCFGHGLAPTLVLDILRKQVAKFPELRELLLENAVENFGSHLVSQSLTCRCAAESLTYSLFPTLLRWQVDECEEEDSELAQTDVVSASDEAAFMQFGRCLMQFTKTLKKDDRVGSLIRALGWFVSRSPCTVTRMTSTLNALMKVEMGKREKQSFLGLIAALPRQTYREFFGPFFFNLVDFIFPLEFKESGNMDARLFGTFFKASSKYFCQRAAVLTRFVRMPVFRESFCRFVKNSGRRDFLPFLEAVSNLDCRLLIDLIDFAELTSSSVLFYLTFARCEKENVEKLF